MNENPTELLRFLRVEGILPALLVLAAAWVAAGFLTRSFARLSERFPDRRLLLSQSKAILRLVVFAIGIGAAVGLLFRLSDEALLALGGTGGAGDGGGSPPVF